MENQDLVGFPTIVTSRRIVPNLQPVAEPHPYRIALIGEAPGEDEENHGIPFCGRSGQHLDRMLRTAGIDRNRCFIGNVCRVRPPYNRITAFPWTGEEIQGGLTQLTQDLAVFNPNLCVLLGNTPLHAAKANRPIGQSKNHEETEDEDEDEKTNKKYPYKITAWRGSLFRGLIEHTPFTGRKCLATLHPAGILRKFEGNPLLDCDLRRALAEGSSAELILPARTLLTDLDCGTLVYKMDHWPAGVLCSVDIEGGLPSNKVNENVKAKAKQRRHLNWKCVALAANPTSAFAIPWWRFSENEHMYLIQSFARLMEREDVPKVLQNSLYDRFVLAYGYGIHIRGVREDTMLKGWEVYCELPKSLGVQASIWTREPHWKDDEMYGGTGLDLAVGCCKDVAVTAELCYAQGNVLTGTGLQHYRTTVEMLNPLLYMELRGIAYDKENAKRKHEETAKELVALGDTLSKSVGTELRGAKGSLSAQRLSRALYETKGYPPQYKKEAGRKTEKLTTDVEAILNLRKKLPGDEFLNGILRHRHLEGLLETLSIKPDSDGRVRCGYNAVGTETGRLTCYTSPTGAGANLQTITKKLRLNYIADPGYDFFQCDLAGADGWTVAAHTARLGDPTMLEDYRFGLKPAKILALLYTFGPEVNLLDRDSLKWWSRSRKNKNDEPLPFDLVSELVGEGIYDCTKMVYHGTDYMMGVPTMRTNVMKKSFKETGVPIYMEHREASLLQSYTHSRYPGIRQWHTWATNTLVGVGKLTSASGHIRIFFGRRFGRDIHDTVKEFLADEPQQNTTWATNLAMLRLWNDPENRRPDGSLIIEPLHQVHDALCGQWPSHCRQWARGKVREYFNNPLTIAGTTLVIPFDGAYGPSWGELPHAL